tara:strand:+ start:323 stop:1255 length:933 start_codon:yes stop_codon:yes gene_type:complete
MIKLKLIDLVIMKKFFKKLYKKFFKRHPLALIGNFLYIFDFNGKITKKAIEKSFGSKKINLIEKSLKLNFIWNYYQLNEGQRRKFNKQNIWGSFASSWHDLNEEQSRDIDSKRNEDKKNLFMPYLFSIIKNNNISRVCEIGTGKGLFFEDLLKLKKDYPDLYFEGYDLNGKCIETAKARFKNHNIKFKEADGISVLKKDLKEGINSKVYILRGTLEYFSEIEIREFFNLVSKMNNTFIILFEPINIDLDSTFESQPRGNLSYSHNYIYLAKNCGLNVISSKVQKIDNNLSLPFYSNIFAVLSSKNNRISN